MKMLNFLQRDAAYSYKELSKFIYRCWALHESGKCDRNMKKLQIPLFLHIFSVQTNNITAIILFVKIEDRGLYRMLIG